MNPLEPPYDGWDAGGMTGRIRGIADQIAAALEVCARDPVRPPIASPDQVAVGALGGSAIAADLTENLYRDVLRQPWFAVRDYHWPGFVTRRSLAVLCSYSGNTEETLALYDEAGARSVPRLALTTGGTLGARCARDGVGVRSLPPGSPPRAAMYASWVHLTHLAHALGHGAHPADAWRTAVARLTDRAAVWAPETPEARNPAKQMARRLDGRHAILYGSERLSALATRIRNQLNENAKLPGHSAVVPELNHNEVVGWEAPGAFAKNATVVLLRDAEDSAPTALRLSLTGEYVARQGADVLECDAEGDSRLVRMVGQAAFWDWVSLYLSRLRGVDPTPIASIDWFKQELEERRNA